MIRTETLQEIPTVRFEEVLTNSFRLKRSVGEQIGENNIRGRSQSAPMKKTSCRADTLFRSVFSDLVRLAYV